MISFHEDQKQWLNEYTAKDLSRTLVREYLYQHSMFKTLNCFENEDKENSKKIVKSTVIKMLCINNLVVNNKNLDKDKKSKSLLLLLTQYLRGKFEERILREERSDCQSQDPKTNKDFSMNGDKLLTRNKQENRIKQKNLVNTKRQQNINQKTLTQQAFYKKKDTTKNQQPITLSKKNSNNMNVEQKKNLTFNRPSTAKPTLGQKKQEKKQEKKVAEIYSKLNTNIRENKHDDNIYQDDPLSIEMKEFQKDKKIQTKKQQQQKSKQISARNTNSAIGRQSNNLVSTTSDSIQNQVKVQKVPNNQPERKQQRYEKDPVPTNKWNTQISETQHDRSLNSQKITDKQKNSDKKKQQSEQYFDEFQQQPQPQMKKETRPQIKKEIKPQIKKESHPQINKESKITEVPLVNTVKAQEKIEKPKINQVKEEARLQQMQIIEPIQQKPQMVVKKVQLEPKAIQQKQQMPEIKLKQQTEALYQPSISSVSRGGMRSLKRTTKPISKDEDATQMIGNNIKLLHDDIKPSNDDPDQKIQLSGLNSQYKEQNTQFKIDGKKDITINSQVKVVQIKKQQQRQQSVPQSNVRQIKLKKKVKPSQQQPVKSTKFKFDDNFVDEPLNGPKQKYQYEKFSFDKMTIKPQLKPKNSNILLQTKINYTQKPTSQSSNPFAQKKKNEKPLSTQKQQQLKKIMFQKGSPYLPKAWHQGFILSPFGDTFYGLKQIEGGPCGIIAALQCFFLKHLMYLSKPTSQNDLKNQIRRQSCLIAALTDILWKVKGPNNDKITLVIPSNRNFSGPKLQFSTLTEVQIQATSFESAYELMWSYKSSFTGQVNHGVIVIIYSVIMTKGIEKIYQQVDMKENPLIGHHGHCTQELVNLFITGKASSNCFDGKKQLQDNFTLHGIDQKSQFGFLTVFETLEYIEVGKNLKNPIFPIWVISKEFHYHVIFGNHYLISQNNDCAKFDLIYFDGLYACDKFIRLTFDQVQKDEFGMVKDLGKIKDLPLIQQVLLKKWGRRKADWNGSTKIL